MKQISEDKVQQSIIIYFTNTYCLKHHEKRGLIFSIPNGSFRDIREAVKLKQTGTLAGASDLIAILPNGALFFIEVKTETGTQSEAQKEFEYRVEKLGYKYRLVRSLEEFKSEIFDLAPTA